MYTASGNNLTRYRLGRGCVHWVGFDIIEMIKRIQNYGLGKACRHWLNWVGRTRRCWLYGWQTLPEWESYRMWNVLMLYNKKIVSKGVNGAHNEKLIPLYAVKFSSRICCNCDVFEQFWKLFSWVLGGSRLQACISWC